jgi:hypothetical protein
LGAFDEQMDLGEDADLTWRALSMGSGVYYEPDAGIRLTHRWANNLSMLILAGAYGLPGWRVARFPETANASPVAG